MVYGTAATTIGVLIAVVLIAGWLVYLLWNLRHARPEAGAAALRAPDATGPAPETPVTAPRPAPAPPKGIAPPSAPSDRR